MRIELTKLNFNRITLSLFYIIRKSNKNIIGVQKGLKPIFFFSLFLFSFLTTTNLYAQPATPSGFVSDFRNCPGEVFLAVGGNDTSDPNIIYRLYYSPTATAPGDPLTATEYSFGSTPGDGNGNSAFGFTLDGLTSGINYTFWLYQYNTSTMQHSTTPAITMETTGDECIPMTPAGFGCNAGSGTSTVFLSVGPNQVGEPNIEYKLYYSTTATAPGDPLTATEYVFGSTAGDGGGNNAFGFTLSGLEPGTSYTFWLYEYNPTSMVFSDSPATCITTSSGMPLPVTWHNPLRAKIEDDKYVIITWSVSEQVNNDKFIIEHSSNGVDFSPIGDIAGEGTTNVMEQYNYTHKNPVLGNNYYRIIQVDFDGRSDNSNVAMVWYGKDQEIKLYPNPAYSELIVHTPKQIEINIKNLYGRLLKTQLLVAGENVLLINDISNGMYILEFENGHIETFIKQ